MSERLIVLSAQDACGALADLRARYRVTSVLPPRLAVLDVEDSEVEALRSRAGVQAIVEPAGAMPAALNPTEQLFVRAWRERHRMHDKERPGDGQAWDTAGHAPPDLPP